MIGLDDHISALRDIGGDDDPALAEATRLRVRRTLDQDHGVRRQLVSLAAALAILLGGTVSWALVTGNLGKLWSAVHERAQISAQVQAPVEQPRDVPTVTAITPPVKRPAPPREPTVIEAPLVEPADVEPHEAAPTVKPVQALYRHAHDLHFHGKDYAASLVAWDAYLAADPSGQFSVEARYNRALCLVRLGRFAEARTALLPFARDLVEPAGYRHDEASVLVQRLNDQLDDHVAD